MSALPTIQRLRRFADAPGDEDAAWVARRLAAYLDGAPDGLSLEQALGIATSPGGVPWWQQQRRAERDYVIRQLAADLPGTTAARAHELAVAMRRYAGAGWRLDRHHGRPTVPGRQRELLFRLFSLDPDPPRIRRLIDIIAS